MLVIEIRDGELLGSIEQSAREHGITDAAIVTLIGAVDSFRISTMPADDATKDIITDYDLPAEMSGTGDVVDGQGAHPRDDGRRRRPGHQRTPAPGPDRHMVRAGVPPA